MTKNSLISAVSLAVSLLAAPALAQAPAAPAAAPKPAAPVAAPKPAAAPALPAVAGSAALPTTSEWAIDAAHSSVGFTVSHLVVSEVDGTFKKYSGKALLDEKDLTKSQVDFTAEVASIDTGEAKRDEHLKSADFFDAAKFPQLTFQSTKITKAGKGYKVKGALTIHGVTKDVTLDATVSAAVKNPWGKQVRAAKITGKIKRADFGLNWNKALEAGGVLVGEEVTLDIKLELNK